MSNIVILNGKLGKDPEIRDAGQTKVCNFSIATNDSYKDKDGKWVKNTDWHSVVCFGKQAEYLVKNANKGDTIHIVGKLTTRTWDGADGKKQYRTEVHAKSLEYCLKKTTVGQAENDDMQFQPTGTI